MKDKFDAMARAAGVEKWRLMQELIRRVELDGDGRPTWWPHEVSDDQEELPLKSA